jgi:S1-C subfamily serine protease
MMIEISLIASILMVILVSSVILLLLPLLSSFTSLTSTDTHAYYIAALAFKPTNKNDTAVSKPPVTVNHPPIVKVGPNQTVNENATVMLVGVAIDPDLNDKLSYSWNQIAGTSVVLNGPNTASPTFTAPSNITSDTELKFALTAKDDKGAINNNPAITTITVKHINHPPVANAGTDQRVNAGYIVSLDGTKSKDPDGNPLTYSWKQVGGPAVTLNGANTATATFAAPSVSSDTVLKFSLTAKDDKGAVSNNPANVSVTVKAAPMQQPTPLTSQQQLPQPSTISEHIQNSVVQITSKIEGNRIIYQAQRSGLGFVYDLRGHIVTTNDILGNSKVVDVTFMNGNKYSAKVVGADPRNNIAVLIFGYDNLTTQLQQGIKPVIVGNSSIIQVGDRVITVGNHQQTTTAIVTKTGLSIPSAGGSVNGYFTTNATVDCGSGGPLFNLKGNLIGMNICQSQGAETTFAIPSNTLEDEVPHIVASAP